MRRGRNSWELQCEFNGLPVTADVIAEVLSTGLGKRINAHELSIYQKRVRQLERAQLPRGLRRIRTLPDQYVPLMDAHFRHGKVVWGNKGRFL
jgi:hypothetical protein